MLTAIIISPTGRAADACSSDAEWQTVLGTAGDLKSIRSLAILSNRSSSGAWNDNVGRGVTVYGEGADIWTWQSAGATSRKAAPRKLSPMLQDMVFLEKRNSSVLRWRINGFEEKERPSTKWPGIFLALPESRWGKLDLSGCEIESGVVRITGIINQYRLTFLISAETHLPQEIHIAQSGEPGVVKYRPEDYRRIQGVWLPHKMLMFDFFRKKWLTAFFSTYELNPDIDLSVFERPLAPEDGPDQWRQRRTAF